MTRPSSVIITAAMVERAARAIYIDHHDSDEHAVAHWDYGGDQHVNREPWRDKARVVLAAAFEGESGVWGTTRAGKSERRP